MTGLLTAASAGITLAGGIVYLLNVRRETRPQVASWAIWTVLAAILVISSLATGQAPAAAYVAADGIMGAVALVAVMRRGDWSLGLLDWVCIAGAAVALVLLAAARSPSAATIAAVTADMFACGPTVAHAWSKPDEEPWTAFAGWAAGGILALTAALSAGHHEVTAVVSPAYLLLANSVVAAVIVARRRASRIPRPVTDWRIHSEPLPPIAEATTVTRWRPRRPACPPPGPWTYPSGPL